MMGLQARNEASVDARNALHAAAARVASIGRIHDALQVGAGKGVVDLGVIFAAMCISLQEMAGDPEQIAVVFDAGDKAALAPAEIAQPIVLAVNELVINALRHAFPDDRVGIVRVTVARIGTEVSVSVADNGVGLPDGYVLGRGFGMNLVRIMVDQLHGELDIKAKKGDGESGTTIAIRAPLVSG
jgi:two-component sensor histidine kinase